ncbi:putative integral membrane protein (TIGR00698 family) [Nocardioides aromaticivorans]|uniref:Putative integral membrane protein (TIGR00698 family) n=1 Tax=Nocardioides aromaticivorans TaxID=200618 RepID=A0A7Y9ZEZ6_9ACTN|nr:putative sulfate exporter family transporter [Nocardioides aromaticivorans]NYI43013.1 putative integral membrane protein (TIGR00698 family) [Nocardioides aromaticivorans]
MARHALATHGARPVTAVVVPAPEAGAGDRSRLPDGAAALMALVAGVVVAFGVHRLVPQVGVLTWAVALGVVAANARLLPPVVVGSLGRPTRRLLRMGVVLLGFSISLAAVADLGLPVLAVTAFTLVGTLVVTTWLARRLAIGPARSLLLGTGFAICGASAIAAMERTADADDEDVTAAIAMVTLWGTVAMVALPVLQAPLGLSATEYGVWAGAGIQEVGQVVAAAGPAGAAALGVAVVVKLTRVLLLAPVVAVVSAGRRMRSEEQATGGRPPLVPLFVLGFLGCALLRTAGLVPDALLEPIAQVQTAALAAALFGMGASVRIGSLLRGSGSLVLAGGLGTVLVLGLSLAGVLVVGAP